MVSNQFTYKTFGLHQLAPVVVTSFFFKHRFTSMGTLRRRG
jgi:hypothetical protein